jgi:hypothetical protein
MIALYVIKSSAQVRLAVASNDSNFQILKRIVDIDDRKYTGDKPVTIGTMFR